MTQDEIIEMARQVGFSQTEGLFRTLYICSPSDLKAFAKLVAAKEREACARLSITIPNPYKDCQISAHGYDMGILEFSRAIRARGEA